MTLAEFRRLTAHLAGERQLLCAGAPVRILWHDEVDSVAIDDGSPFLDGCEDEHTILYERGTQWCET